jgi:ubiquitin-conjugating enzyme E2 Z
MSIFVSKETIQRLLKDVKHIIKNPLTEHGIYYIHHDTDVMKGYACIVGPEDTPYFGGYYFFEISYPFDYPHNPPKVTYCTNAENIRFNPNLYKCGKVCVSLLNTWRGEQWTSCQSISTVLLTLCTLLCKNPLLNEPGVHENHSDMKNYNTIIEYANIHIAVCNLLQRKEGVYLPFFENFYPFMKERFIQNYDKLLSLAELRHMEYQEKPLTDAITTAMYSLRVKINYSQVVSELKDCHSLLSSSSS